MVLRPPHGFMPQGVELKAERRKPSFENHGKIKDIPTLTGVLACFHLHQNNAFGHKNNDRQLPARSSFLGNTFRGF